MLTTFSLHRDENLHFAELILSTGLELGNYGIKTVRLRNHTYGMVSFLEFFHPWFSLLDGKLNVTESAIMYF